MLELDGGYRQKITATHEETRRDVLHTTLRMEPWTKSPTILPAFEKRDYLKKERKGRSEWNGSRGRILRRDRSLTKLYPKRRSRFKLEVIVFNLNCED